MSATPQPTDSTPPAGRAAAAAAAAVRYLQSLPTTTVRDGRRRLADLILVANLDEEREHDLRAHRAALAMFDRELAARAPSERIGAHAERPAGIELSGEDLLADLMEGGPGGRRSHDAHPYAGSEL